MHQQPARHLGPGDATLARAERAGPPGGPSPSTQGARVDLNARRGGPDSADRAAMPRPWRVHGGLGRRGPAAVGAPEIRFIAERRGQAPPGLALVDQARQPTRQRDVQPPRARRAATARADARAPRTTAPPGFPARPASTLQPFARRQAEQAAPAQPGSAAAVLSEPRWPVRWRASANPAPARRAAQPGRQLPNRRRRCDRSSAKR